MSGNETRDELCASLMSYQWTNGIRAAHAQHRFDAQCAICTHNVEAVAEAVVALGWQPPTAEVNLVSAVAELAEVADDIRFMHRGELADRLDAIIAHHFGYIAVRIGEETANA